MQQHQEPQRRFADPAPQQVVHRFPQNQQNQGWQPQGYPQQPHQQPVPMEEYPRGKRRRKPRKRHFSLVWNALAIVGLITVLVQLARYVVVPLLVFLQGWLGGAA